MIQVDTKVTNKVLTLILPIILLAFSVNSHSKEVTPNLSTAKTAQHYKLLKQEIKREKATQLKECNCMKAFYRNLFLMPDNSARYVFDRTVGESAIQISQNKDTVNVLAIGSGTLLNELTAVSNILARGKNLNLYIIDYAYVFYGDKHFEKQAIRFGKHPELIPDNWRDFHFWDIYSHEKKQYLPFFKEHHTAITQFKNIMKNLDQHYGTHTQITVLKPPTDQPLKLSGLDMIISIDSFIDVPNIIWNLFYQFQIETNKPIRFLALNKSKPLGGFWEPSNSSTRENASLKPVMIHVYDIHGSKASGSYQLIDTISLKANQTQMRNAPEFLSYPDQDSTQSPFDMAR